MSSNDRSAEDTDKLWGDDFNQPLLQHRSIAAASIPETFSVIPGSQPAITAQWTKNKASRILMRVFVRAAAAAETVTLSTNIFPIAGILDVPDDFKNITREQAGGLEIGSVLYTCSGREYTNIHPITGQAAPATKYFAASAVTPAFRQHTDIIRFAPDPADATNYPATGRELLTTIDVFGHNGLYIGASAKSAGMLEVIVALMRMT